MAATTCDQRRAFQFMLVSWLYLVGNFVVARQPSAQCVEHLSQAVGCDKDEKKDQCAEDGTREPLGHTLCEVRNEHDERCAGEGAWQPADTANDHPEEQRSRELERVCIGRG